MKTSLINKVILSGRYARKAMDTMTLLERKKLESAWDVEHAYYSSVLEGCRIAERLNQSIKEKFQNISDSLITKDNTKPHFYRKINNGAQDGFRGLLTLELKATRFIVSMRVL